MVTPPGESTPRPRPRPPAKVAGQRQKTPSRAGSAEAAPAKAAPAKTAPPLAATQAPGTKTSPRKPAPPKTAATRAAVAQAAAAKTAAARRSAGKTAAAQAGGAETAPPKSAAKPAPTKRAVTLPRDSEVSSKTTSTSPALASTARRRRQRSARHREVNLVLVVLSVLALLAAAAVTVLVVQRVTTPPTVDPELLPAAAQAYSAMYSFDYTDPDGSVRDSLAVLTGDLRERFEEDLDGQVVPSYLEVSATTRVDNITIGLQDINEEQTEAVVIAYGTFVVNSVNSGQQSAPTGSECAVTDDGADACVQTLQLNLVNVDGTWLVSDLTTLTTA